MGFHGVTGTQSSIPIKREERSQRRPRQLAGGAPRRTPGTATRRRAPLGGRTQGAAGSPPSRMSSAGCGLPHPCVCSSCQKLCALTRPAVCTALTRRELSRAWAMTALLASETQ